MTHDEVQSVIKTCSKFVVVSLFKNFIVFSGSAMCAAREIKFYELLATTTDPNILP